MKKFYTIVLALLISAICDNAVNAQPVCPADRKVFNVQLVTPTGIKKLIYIEKFYPNGAIVGITSNPLGNFNTNKLTDAVGNGSFFYTINNLAEVCVLLSGEPCCSKPIPAISCPANLELLRVRYETPAGPVCAVYTRLVEPGQQIRLFDGNGNIIPYAESNDPDIQINDLVCLVYDCSLQPTTIAINTTSGTCSRPMPEESPLPVKWVSFTANLSSSSSVTLDWKTAQEIGSDKFIVEKSLDGGRTYAAIAEVASNGTSSIQSTYNYVDNNFAGGAAFYRLKQVDIDGKYEYSKVAYINAGATASNVRIFPNPFHADVQLLGASSADLNSKNLKIFSLTGAQIAYRKTGANAITIDETAPSGVYILQFKGQTFKLIKD